MTTIYGIKNCDTVRKATKWLTTQGIIHDSHDFRINGIDEILINRWLQDVPLEQLINKRSTSWKQLSVAEKDSLSMDTAAALCVKYETLIKRPVLVHNNKIFVGFTEKNYQAIFNN